MMFFVSLLLVLVSNFFVNFFGSLKKEEKRDLTIADDRARTHVICCWRLPHHMARFSSRYTLFDDHKSKPVER